MGKLGTRPAALGPLTSLAGDCLECVRLQLVWEYLGTYPAVGGLFAAVPQNTGSDSVTTVRESCSS